jgi:hypothetical protein
MIMALGTDPPLCVGVYNDGKGIGPGLLTGWQWNGPSSVCRRVLTLWQWKAFSLFCLGIWRVVACRGLLSGGSRSQP